MAFKTIEEYVSHYKDSRNLNLEEIKPTGFVQETSKTQSIKLLTEIKKYVDELLDFKEHNSYPQQLANKISEFNGGVLNFAFKMELVESDSPDNIARNKETVAKDIRNYYNECFNLDRKDKPNLLDCYSYAKSLNKPDNDFIDELNGLKTDLADNISNAADLVKSLEGKDGEVDTILEELKKKASQQTVSDYAIVFGNEAVKYKDFAKNWLITGICISVVFVVFMILSALTKFLPTEIVSETGVFLRYDFTNLASKVIIIAVIIFLMSFAFKQYSVNKHLQTLSQHRQNALNSYKLLTASIIGDDTNSRNALMIQVAKAIYEHSQSTGFLNEKGQNVNSGIIELTKIIGENRPS